MAAARRAAIDAAGHGEHLAALLHGVPGGNQRPGALGGFDDDHAQAQAGDDSIALRKRAGKRRRARRVFADHCAVQNDFVGQRLVFRRIDVQHAAAEHGDRAAAGLQRPAMSGGVDAAGQAADDRIAAAGQASRQPFGLGQAVLGAVARADDGDGQCHRWAESGRGQTARPADRESSAATADSLASDSARS